MSITVVNVGMLERDTSGRRTTNQTKAFSNAGSVTVTIGQQSWTFAPGQRITFSDDGLGIAVAAFDARLRVADTRDGDTGRH